MTIPSGSRPWVGRRLGLGITTKLLAFNLLVFLVFGLVVAIVSLSFRSIEGLLTATIVKDVNENIDNAGLLRDLSAVFADANLLASTFFKKEDLLKTRGGRLVEATKALERRSTYGPLKDSLEEFSQRLGLLFEECAQVNRILRRAERDELALHSNLTNLEKTISDKKVDQILAGEDSTFMEQLSVLVSGYRETFLQIDIMFLRSSVEGFPREQPSPGAPVIALIDDLRLRAQTLTASEPRIAAYAPRLLRILDDYRAAVLQFFDAMGELNRRLASLEESKTRVISVMEEIEQHIASSTLSMRRKISGVMSSTAATIMVVSVAILAFLGSLTFFLILSNIRKPMAVIRAGIESIRAGDLDTRIDLKRRDEWSVIETALNRMASDLKSSYTELRDKNTELVAESETRKRLEDQLRQAQKMEAIGTLAGGVAHDFNNILTAVIGHGSLLRLQMAEGHPLRSYVDDILSSSQRAATLTKHLLAFSRKQLISPRPLDLNEIVKRIEALLVRVIGEDVEFKTQLADGNLTVMADSGQIEQVLMNLATNARDAMPNGGILSIRTERAEFGQETPGSFDYIKPGAYAVVSVSDTGRGMEEATKRRIFEPFFTTKQVGKGTGLGLSIVYGIIKQHNGEINVYSEPGKGTTFKIYLKLVASRAEGTEAPLVTPLPVGGSETILVAEDDVDVRKLITKVLKQSGYTVIEAIDGEDAVRKFAESKESVQLLILDVVMPKKNGREAYEEIRKLKADVRVLFTSGYTADIIGQKGVLDEGLNFVSKPVAPQALLSKVREALGDEPPEGSGQIRSPV